MVVVIVFSLYSVLEFSGDIFCFLVFVIITWFRGNERGSTLIRANISGIFVQGNSFVFGEIKIRSMFL